MSPNSFLILISSVNCFDSSQSMLWKWSDIKQKASTKLKILTGASIIAYFEPNKQMDIIIDVSPVWIGTILNQKGKVMQAEWKRNVSGSICCWVLLSLLVQVKIQGNNRSQTTFRYCQKPVMIHREYWRLWFMPNEYELIYHLGWNEKNPADYLSQHPHQ